MIKRKSEEHGFALTRGQKEKLTRAYRNKSNSVIRFKNRQLSRLHKLIITKTQLHAVRRHMRNGTGMDLKISRNMIRKQSGGSLISFMLKLAMPLAKRAIGPLTSGVLSGLSSLGVNKIFGDGLFSVPQDKIDKLIKYEHLLSESQKKQILSALQTGGGTGGLD